MHSKIKLIAVYCTIVFGFLNSHLLIAKPSANKKPPEEASTKKKSKPKSEHDEVSKKHKKVLNQDEDDDEPSNKTTPSDEKRFGLGLNIGSNATYGNSISGHFSPIEMLALEAGIGYNTTGLKIGLGAGFVLPIERFGIDVGLAFVHSSGIKDKVSLPAKFVPEGSSTEENITVSKEFTLTPANYISCFVGAYFDVLTKLRILGHINYNKVISGNDVKFASQAQYDKPIDPTNESDVQADFDPKATEKLDINGLGFSIGAQFRF